MAATGDELLDDLVTTTELPKAICSVCGQRRAIRADGTMRQHGPLPDNVCRGSHLLPASTPEKPDRLIQEQAKVGAYELAHKYVGQSIATREQLQGLIYQALVAVRLDAIAVGGGLRRAERTEQALADMPDVDMTNRRINP